MDYTWDLSVLYDSFEDKRIEEDMTACEKNMDLVEQLLASDMSDKEKLEAYCDASEEGDRLSERLWSFANLTLSVDATNAAALQLMDRLEAMSVRQGVISAAAGRYIGSVENLRDVIASSEKLKAVDFALHSAAEQASHIPDETIYPWLLKMSLNGGNAFSNLRDRLDATHMVDYRGQSLPLAAVRAMAYDPDPAVRKDAYEAEIASYKKIEIPMAACLNAIKGEALTMIEAEHFDSVLEKTLEDSNMDKATLDAMWEAIREALPDFRRYLRKKGELLGHKNGLPFYDLFAPLSKGETKPKEYTVEQAREKLVFEMSKFSPEMGQFIAHAFDNRWIDLFPREGKGGGAFCSGLHQYDQSRVLTNFAGSFSDVSTIAHELGHAWHNRCMKGLPFMMTDAPMPLAETASIFNETLLAHAAMKEATPEERFALLEGNLMETTQTMVDIYSRFLFESAVIEGKKTHNATPEELCALMLDAQEQSYGDGLDKEIRHPYMWACKCHYYFAGLNFYNFPYAFGQLFGTGMFAQYQAEGAAFVLKYNKLLRSCGSMKVADVAASVGIDVRSVDFWRGALKVYVDEINEFIALADTL